MNREDDVLWLTVRVHCLPISVAVYSFIPKEINCGQFINVYMSLKHP